jgi:AcrR family transcriptional regulator
MRATRPARPLRKQPDRYHHGDLARAMLQEAVRVIKDRGVEALTLRGVGETLGVSRTALYRHFTDKQALLTAVAREGFRTLRTELHEAWLGGGRGREGFERMGEAYVRFAVANPSHYRVMFGGLLESGETDIELGEQAGNAFQLLVDALAEQQQAGLVRKDDTLMLARYIWAIVHGVAMLALDGQLQHQQTDAETLIRFANERMRTGIAVS